MKYDIGRIRNKRIQRMGRVGNQIPWREYVEADGVKISVGEKFFHLNFCIPAKGWLEVGESLCIWIADESGKVISWLHDWEPQTDEERAARLFLFHEFASLPFLRDVASSGKKEGMLFFFPNAPGMLSAIVDPEGNTGFSFFMGQLHALTIAVNEYTVGAIEPVAGRKNTPRILELCGGEKMISFVTPAMRFFGTKPLAVETLFVSEDGKIMLFRDKGGDIYLDAESVGGTN